MCLTDTCDLISIQMDSASLISLPIFPNSLPKNSDIVLAEARTRNTYGLPNGYSLNTQTTVSVFTWNM